MFAFFFSFPRIQAGRCLPAGEPLPNSTVTGVKTSNLLWVFFVQLFVGYCGGFKQNDKDFLSPDCLAYIVGILLISYLLMASHCLVTLCKAPFMAKLRLIFAGSSVFSQWVSHCHGQPSEMEWAQRSFLQRQVGISQGSLIAVPSFLTFPYSPAWMTHPHSSFYLTSLGWTAPPRQPSTMGTRQKWTWGLWILGKSMISALQEGVLLLKTTSWILSLFSQL